MKISIQDAPPSSSNVAGFTLLELMVAATIFAIILLVIAVGAVRFTTDYYRGITQSKTQAAARSIMSQLSQSVEFGKTVTIIPTDTYGVGGVCLDNTLFAFKIPQQVTDISPDTGGHQGFHGLLASSGGCGSSDSIPNSILTTLGDASSSPGTPDVPASSRELLGQHMRVAALDVNQSGQLYTIHIRLIYGDDDLLSPTVTSSTDWANETCASTAGSQFCAVSDLTTTVAPRLQ